VAALELKFGGLLDRDIARLRALKNHTHIVGSTSLKGRKTIVRRRLDAVKARIY
jgi:hypothetical protein